MSSAGQSSAGSRPPLSNSVDSATAENPASEKSDYERRVEERAAECVEEFRERYAELASMPVSAEHGQSVRPEVVEEVVVEEYVEPESEFDQGFTVERLDRHRVKTWADAMFEFLVGRQKYDDGMAGRFESPEGDEFDVPFYDCWTTEYAREQRARMAGGQRQLMGGEYPESDESARAGESVDGEWSDDVATVMLTRTGSSVPDGERVAPIDHINEVARSWSQGNVYDRVRNFCEFELGLESDEWEYVRSDDAHGLGDSDDVSGDNACYVHCHDVIFVDLSGTDLRDEFGYGAGADEQIRTVLENGFYGAIERHLEVCDLADPEAHTKERAVDVRFDLAEPAAYAAKYALLSEDDEEMMDQEVEYQAFATIEWAAGRQRIARSKGFNAAARADLCLQDPDVEHGGRLEYDRHGDVQCSHCTSSVGIGAETITEFRLKNSESERREAERRERKIGARIGEPRAAAAARSRAERYVDEQGRPESVATAMGRLDVDPEHRAVVEEAIAGEDTSSEPEPVMGEGTEVDPTKHELRGLVLPDGGFEEVGAPGGGRAMVETVLPVERLLSETRLQYVGGEDRPKIVVEDGDESLATYEPEVAAGWLADRGYREPWHAELALSFTRHESGPVPARFGERVAEPPDRIAAG